MTTKKKSTRATAKQADLSAVDWEKLEQDVFAEIERRRFAAALAGECSGDFRATQLITDLNCRISSPPAVRSESEKIVQAFLAEVAEAAEAGVKITTLSGLGGKRRKRRIAAAGGRLN